MEWIERVYNFWFLNNKYKSYDLWFQKNKKIRDQIDDEIANKFILVLENIEKNFEFLKENGTPNSLLSIVIVLDQFTRHMFRGNEQKKQQNTKLAVECALLALDRSEIVNWGGEELAFLLMPLKHQNIHIYFPKIRSCVFEWFYKNKESQHLLRFYKDSLVKYSLLENQVCAMNLVEPANLCVNISESDIKSVCEKYYENINDGKYVKKIEKFFCNVDLENAKKIGVSLSGGVDSMLLITLLKKLESKFNFQVFGIHINYHNRKVADIETEMVKRYCLSLNIPLYIRKIWEIHRKDIDSNIFLHDEIVMDRVFYEKVTRDIRFDFYRQFDCPIILGHNYDDVIENVWTNFGKGKELFNLQKMEFECVMEGVKVWRPFLMTKKDEIYKVAEEFRVPFLLNTTPELCNRGKMRLQFVPSTRAQFGDAVDDNILYMNDSLREYGAYLDETLFTPFCENLEKIFVNDGNLHCGYRTELRKEHYKLGKHFWSNIFKKIFHSFSVAIPSRKSIEKFLESLKFHQNDPSKLCYCPLRMEIAIFLKQNVLYIFQKQIIIDHQLLEDVSELNQFQKKHFKILARKFSY